MTQVCIDVTDVIDKYVILSAILTDTKYKWMHLHMCSTLSTFN